MSNRQEILELLGNGKITADEAAKMLGDVPVETTSAKEIKIEVEQDELKQEEKREAVSGKSPSWFRVRVRNLETGKNKVNVNIPIGMLKFGMKIGKKFTSELDDLNWEDVNGMMSGMHTGMLVEVQDEESNEHVQVYLE